jgi:hypothetical protein
MAYLLSVLNAYLCDGAFYRRALLVNDLQLSHHVFELGRPLGSIVGQHGRQQIFEMPGLKSLII